MAQKISDNPAEKPQPAASVACEIHLTETAEAAYKNYFTKAQKAVQRGDFTNAHCTTLRLIDEVLENIIPHNPFDSRYALAGDLRPIHRIKKGRIRICWVGSLDKRRVCILFISESLRKAGDANDPYRILTKLVQNGTYDEFFKELGITPPPIAPSYPTIQ